MKRHPGILLSGLAMAVVAATAWGKDGGDVVERPPPPRVSVRRVAAKPQQQAPPPATETLQKWVQDLDSNEFVVRETATENLIAAGSAAINPLKAALAKTRSLEVTTRSLYVLQQLALADDLDTVDAARNLIDELAAKRNTATGRRAANALIVINERRSAQALDELQELGANVLRGQAIDANGGLVETIESIEIGTSWTGTEHDLRRLKWLTEVERLVLVGENVGDAALQQVAKMQDLRSLQAYHAKITDGGMKALAALEKLQEIGVYYVPITDAAIEALQANKGLTTIRLYGTEVTKDSVDKLQAALGGVLKVDYRKGAFLGIGCDAFNGQCMINTVHQNSPADKAGVRSEDLIVKFDGHKVTSFQELTAVISNYRAGDTINLELQRYVITEEDEAMLRNVNLKVTLGEWDVSLFIGGRLGP